ncbi:ABC transporter substrate-binding protein [Kitasatospora sp. NBC_01250]|uniref:ABC transporter substrate-binding protein n=1 Tax=unclassified Kitasatospora TaxID=2633591 RepID=UPI002E0EF8BA|nr:MULTISPECIES: ABC transporter substrate-binding protein [unclassified Kitasatospora]WSJ65304.1 ABC transporter substrate-binding protein [Kitasatospora sp. NBC_01302]
MHSSPARRLSRRGLLAAGGATALGALLTACNSGGTTKGGSAPASGTAKQGPWSFTDDQPKQLGAPSAPTRIVAFTGAAAALVDFGLDRQITGVFGETRAADGKADPQAGDLDIDKVTIVGNAYGEFDLEKYAALRPDLLVTHMYDPGAFWYVPDESKAKILQINPDVAAITVARVPITQPIERYAALAASLGADLGAKKVTDAKARFEAASESVRQAAKAAGGIKVLAASGSPDLFYASNPQIATDLMYFAQLGVDLVVPNELGTGGYFEGLSWENAGKYPADLILLDDRSLALQPKDLSSRPTWNQLPAVKAGQVTPWSSVPRFSYAGAAPLLERLAKAVQSAKKVS